MDLCSSSSLLPHHTAVAWFTVSQQINHRRTMGMTSQSVEENSAHCSLLSHTPQHCCWLLNHGQLSSEDCCRTHLCHSTNKRMFACLLPMNAPSLEGGIVGDSVSPSCSQSLCHVIIHSWKKEIRFRFASAKQDVFTRLRFDFVHKSLRRNLTIRIHTCISWCRFPIRSPSFLYWRRR